MSVANSSSTMERLQPVLLFMNRDKLSRSILVTDAILGILESRDILLDSDMAHLRNSEQFGMDTVAHELLRILAVREDGYNQLVDVLTRDEQFESVVLLTDGIHEGYKMLAKLVEQEFQQNANASNSGATSAPKSNLFNSLMSSYQTWAAPFGELEVDHRAYPGTISPLPDNLALEGEVIPAPEAFPVPNSEACYYYNQEYLIGEGPSGGILQGYWGKDKKVKVAVKLVYKNASTVSVPDLSIAKDIKSTGNARTHHVVPVLSFTEIQDAIFIVSELATTNLVNAIKHIQRLSSDKNRLIKAMDHVVGGLYWLHQHKNRVHGNLKPQNVLLFVSDTSLVFKLSDFGLSRRIPDKHGVYSYGKDCDIWMAPERLNALQSQVEMVATKNMDIWSLGLLIYYCLSGGKHPFAQQGEDDDKLLLTRIKDPKISASHLETTHWRIPAADSLVQWMLQKEADRRPDISNVRSHPMFWNEEKCLSFLETVSKSLNQSDSELREIRKNVDEVYGNYFKEKYGEDFEWRGLMDWQLLEAAGGKKDYDWGSVTSLVELISDKAADYHDGVGSGGDDKRKEFAENLLPLFPDLVVSLFCLLAKAARVCKFLGAMKQKYFGGYLEDESSLRAMLSSARLTTD